MSAILSPTFVIISLVNFLGMAAYYAAFVVSATFMSESYGAGAALSGLATGIVVIGCLIGRFFTGSVVHSFGYKRILLVGVSCFCLTNALYLLPVGAGGYVLTRFLSGAAIGVMGTVTGTLVALITPRPCLGRGIAYFSLSTALAVSAGPFIGIALLDRLGCEGVFAVSLGLALIALILAVCLRLSLPTRSGATKKLSLSSFVDLRLTPFCLIICLLCLPWGSLQAFMASYAKAFGVVGAASLFFLVYSATIIVSRPVTGRVYDRHGPAVVFYPAMLALAAGLALLWLSPDAHTVLLAGVLMGFGFGNIQSVGQSTAVAMVERDRFAQATSTFYIFFDLGISLAPYLFGMTLDRLGYDGVFGVNAAIVLGCVPLYWLSRGLRRRRPSSGEAV